MVGHDINFTLPISSESEFDLVSLKLNRQIIEPFEFEFSRSGSHTMHMVKFVRLDSGGMYVYVKARDLVPF
jgi:hypothetical protein